jgi:hypothetical protein
VAIPLACCDAQVGLGVGQNGLSAFQFLEGFDTPDQIASQEFEPLVVLLLGFAFLWCVRVESPFGLGRFLGKLRAG